MVLILSYKSYEQSTDPVIEWLKYYEYPFLKLSFEDFRSKDIPFVIQSNDNSLIINGRNLTKEVGAIFYRRLQMGVDKLPIQDLGTISKKIVAEANAEYRSMINYLFYQLRGKAWFPRQEVFSVNKEVVLREAELVGLSVPQSIITNSRAELCKFKMRYKRVIYKPLDQISYYTIGDYTYSCRTTEVTRQMLKDLPEFFFPSLFQEYILPLYEIRTFYLDGTFFSSAILLDDPSSRSVDIKMDFNEDSTNWVPYDLPPDIKNKINLLMQKLGLNTGSFDLIHGVDDRFYFLEVNPVGQYLAPSYTSNYHIEKHIAEWLIKKDRSIILS